METGSSWSEDPSPVLVKDDELPQGIDIQITCQQLDPGYTDWQPVPIVTMTGGNSVKTRATGTLDQVKGNPHVAKLEASVSGIKLI